MAMGQVKAILFDSGRVLNYPASGHWFMPPGFFDQVDREAFSALGRKRTAWAFRRAEEQIGARKLIRTTEELAEER